MKTKLLALVVVLATIGFLSLPVFALKGPVMDSLRIKFYGGNAPLFTGLLNGEIDYMAWPLSKTQYDTIASNPNFTVAPYYDMGDYEIAFNSNYTVPNRDWRNPLNYTVFRQASACLVDKDGLMVSTEVGGFGTRIDTSMPRPILDTWVNFSVSEYDSNGVKIGNYPWEYNVTKALELLYNAGWYSTASYPSFASLQSAYTGGSLNVGTSNPSIVIYPAGHSKAGSPLDNLKLYIRSDHPPRKVAGEQLAAAWRSIGIQLDVTEGSSGVCYVPVFEDREFHLYTSGWSFGARPLHFWSMFTPAGIGPDLSNFYMVDDGLMTLHAGLEYPYSTSQDMSKAEAKICQGILVDQAYLVPLFSSRSYLAYRTGMLAITPTRGYGLTAAADYAYMESYDQNYPATTNINHGDMNPPEQINPIFGSWVWDYLCIDRIFTSGIIFNPYKPSTPGHSPAGGDQPWMCKDWLFYIDTDGNASVHYWFRDDIYWHDGVQFTVDDFNYTIYLGQTYGDAWSWSDMVNVQSFTKINNFECIVHFSIPTFWTYTAPMYDMIPKHIYENIPIALYPSDQGHHGFWPGQNQASPFHSGNWRPDETWVGTNMWAYQNNTVTQGIGGGVTLYAYPNFWMKLVPGEIDFNYFFNAGAPPQGGNYAIGLSDLVLLANAYGTVGTPAGSVPFKIPGDKGAWNSGCDLAKPAGVVGLSDLVTLARNYGATWGTYT
jgi:hypothetical protein